MVRKLAGDDYDQWVLDYSYDENSEEKKYVWDTGIEPESRFDDDQVNEVTV